MALGNPSFCPNIWEKNDTHLLHDFSYSPQNKAVNFQLTEKRVMFSIQGLTSELMWWYDSALTQTFKEMNMTIFFSFYMLGHKIGWIRELKGWEKIQPTVFSAPTAHQTGARVQRRQDVPASEETRGPHRGGRLRPQWCSCRVYEMHLGTRGNTISPYRLTQEQASLQTLWGSCAHLTGVPRVIKLL